MKKNILKRGGEETKTKKRGKYEIKEAMEKTNYTGSGF